MVRALLIVALVLLGIVPNGDARAETQAGCAASGGTCTVPGGFYMAAAPEGWDGKRPLALLFHLHGFRENADELIRWVDLKAIAARHDALLVVPQGMGQTWAHPGSPSQSRDDFAFIAAVMTDLKQRWPIVPERMLASGFSQGASMLWNLACASPVRFSGYLTISGAFWRPEPERCPILPGRLLHVHGLADRTVPLEGRPIRNGQFHQGDVFHALGLLRAGARCEAPASRARRRGALLCEDMGGCAGGQHYALCLHPGGHDFDPSWIDLAFRLLGEGGQTSTRR